VSDLELTCEHLPAITRCPAGSYTLPKRPKLSCGRRRHAPMLGPGRPPIVIAAFWRTTRRATDDPGSRPDWPGRSRARWLGPRGFLASGEPRSKRSQTFRFVRDYPRGADPSS
jgi:hypothetical protein